MPCLFVTDSNMRIYTVNSKESKRSKKSVYTTPGKLKNQPDHGGNRTRDL